MIRNTESGRFTPCEPDVNWFIADPIHGESGFINQDGQVVVGIYKDCLEDTRTEPGYKKHLPSCKGRQSA